MSLVGGTDSRADAEWFLRNSPNRFNVAVSRAKAVLHVFGDTDWARPSGSLHVRRPCEGGPRDLRPGAARPSART